MTKAKPRFAKHALLLYLFLAFGISWLVWLPLILSQSSIGMIHADLPTFPWVPAGTIGPIAAALITQKLCCGNFHAFRLWTSLRQLFLGAVVGLICVLLARWLLSGLALTKSGYDAWNWAALLDFRYYFIPNLIGGPLGEEPGWRGFALPRLQSRYGPTRASLLLGPIWAAWHLPLFLVHGWTTAPFWIFALILTALSVIMTFGFNLSGGNVIVAILMHDAFNAGGGPLNNFLAKASLRQHPNSDLLVGCAFLAMAFVLIMLTAGRLGLKRSDAPTLEAAS